MKLLLNYFSANVSCIESRLVLEGFYEEVDTITRAECRKFGLGEFRFVAICMTYQDIFQGMSPTLSACMCGSCGMSRMDSGVTVVTRDGKWPVRNAESG